MIGVKHSQGKLPYFTVLIEQFPLAIKEVVKRAEYGHQKYIETDADYKNWQRIPNAEMQYKNAAMRHLFQDGEEGEDEIQHLAAAAWSLLAVLQLKLTFKEHDIVLYQGKRCTIVHKYNEKNFVIEDSENTINVSIEEIKHCN